VTGGLHVASYLVQVLFAELLHHVLVAEELVGVVLGRAGPGVVAEACACVDLTGGYVVVGGCLAH